MNRLLCLLACLAAAPSFGAGYGAQSMTDPLTRVLVKRPDAAFAVENPKKWHYTGRPILNAAQREHDAFVALLEREGIEVVYDRHSSPELADSIFVHDPVLVTDHGAVILRMGKQLRRGEEQHLEETLRLEGIPVLGRLTGEATAEAGDMLWLDHDTLCVGRSYRTNVEGIRQLREILEPEDVKVLAFDLPHSLGRDACLHLQSFVSLVDQQTALVYLPLAPVAFIELLQERGFQLIEVPELEYASMAPNLLALRPGVVVTLEGNPETKRRLEAAGVRVLTYRGEEISMKAEGGATCLTRPLLRRARS